MLQVLEFSLWLSARSRFLLENTWRVNIKAYDTGSSQAVPHPSTIPARRCLTSVIGRERVFSSWYGRRHLNASFECSLCWLHFPFTVWLVFTLIKGGSLLSESKPQVLNRQILFRLHSSCSDYSTCHFGARILKLERYRED